MNFVLTLLMVVVTIMILGAAASWIYCGWLACIIVYTFQSYAQGHADELDWAESLLVVPVLLLGPISLTASLPLLFIGWWHGRRDGDVPFLKYGSIKPWSDFDRLRLFQHELESEWRKLTVMASAIR